LNDLLFTIIHMSFLSSFSLSLFLSFSLHHYSLNLLIFLFKNKQTSYNCMNLFSVNLFFFLFSSIFTFHFTNKRSEPQNIMKTPCHHHCNNKKEKIGRRREIKAAPSTQDWSSEDKSIPTHSRHHTIF
jgi:ABC-type Fe3+ transport system permease subunit